MIFLTPFVTESRRAELKERFARMSDIELIQFSTSLAKIGNAPLRNDMSMEIEVDSAISSDDVLYTNIDIIITARFKKDGIQYLSNGALAIDFDRYLSIVNDAMN